MWIWGHRNWEDSGIGLQRRDDRRGTGFFESKNEESKLFCLSYVWGVHWIPICRCIIDGCVYICLPLTEDIKSQKQKC